MARVFKARMILYAAYGHCIIREDGSYYEHPRWFELAKEKWAQVYKTTGTPCSCWIPNKGTRQLHNLSGFLLTIC